MKNSTKILPKFFKDERYKLNKLCVTRANLAKVRTELWFET